MHTNSKNLPQQGSVTNNGSLIRWEEPVLLGGSPSSGSTLLSVLMDTHPDIVCGPEISLFSHPFFWNKDSDEWRTHLLQHLPLGASVVDLEEWTLDNDVCPYTELVYDNTLSWYGLSRSELIDLVKQSSSPNELVQKIYTDKMKLRKKRLWADKSPPNLYSFKAFLNYYPKGKVIYLVRDGRDVVSSLMRRGFSFKRALSVWLVETAICETFNDHPRALRVRYEDLVFSPQETLQTMFEFLNVVPEVDYVLGYLENSERVQLDSTIGGYDSWKNNPRNPISTSSVGGWKKEMSQEQLLAFYASSIISQVSGYDVFGKSASDMLSKLGYELTKPIEVDSYEFADFAVREGLFLNRYDYANPKVFQERFVGLSISQLPAANFSWDTQMMSAKINDIQSKLPQQGVLEENQNQIYNILISISNLVWQVKMMRIFFFVAGVLMALLLFLNLMMFVYFL
jgi:hypothetical protein